MKQNAPSKPNFQEQKELPDSVFLATMTRSLDPSVIFLDKIDINSW